MSAFTDPSSVPIHSPTTGTSICTTGTTRTSTGWAGGASWRAQAPARRRVAATSSRRLISRWRAALRTKTECGDDAEDDEDHEHDPLGDHERRLGLLGGERPQGGDLQERLHHRHEDVQVQRERGADHVHATPGAAEVEAVPRRDGGGEDDQ